MIDLDIIKSAKEHIANSSLSRDTDYFCVSRDIFQARLDSFVRKSNRYLESALIGEIGNNTFDHNWQYQENQMRGSYLNLNFMDRYVVLADYGRGIRQSLSAITNLSSDVEAVQTGFTKQISGRTPEQHGNGLKFVSESVIEKLWSLYYQSGNGCCVISDGKIDFFQADDLFTGCFAVFDFGWGRKI